MFLRTLAIAAAVGSAVAQRPANISICDYYTTALLTNNTAANQMTLLTLVVNTAVIGNCKSAFSHPRATVDPCQTPSQTSASPSLVSSPQQWSTAPQSASPHTSLEHYCRLTTAALPVFLKASSMVVELLLS